MSVNNTWRSPNFSADVYTYGKVGERYFLNKYGKGFASKGYTIYDVSSIPFWQKIDIDFVISKSDKPLMSTWECVMDKAFTKIEVKVDTRAHDTGNLPYEVISHGNFGWSINTHADKVLMILCKDGFNNGMLYAYEEYLIDMKKWKEFASYASNSFRSKPNAIYGEEIYDFLHKIEEMKSVGVIVAQQNINAYI